MRTSTEKNLSELSQLNRRVRLLKLLLIILVLTVLASATTVSAQKKDSCVECHSQMEGSLGEPVKLGEVDIHRARGLSCSDCHGGDPSQDDPGGAMNKARGFVGKPAPKELPRFCGKCHSNAEFMKKFNPTLRVDQESEYATSVHGKRLAAGDTKVATCISCHGFHDVRGVGDPQARVYALNVAETCASCHANAEKMQGYNIAHDQYEKYKKSVHAQALYERQDLSAPTCNDCHGNHGATPPGIASVGNVCGQCHVRQETLFAASPHKPAFELMQLGDCVRCHNNHDIAKPSDELVGTTDKALCIECHVEGDGGFTAATQLRKMLDQLDGKLTSARAVLGQAERAGMEVSRPRFDLTEANDDLTHSRVLIHSFSPAEVDKMIQPGLAIAEKSEKAGHDALAELKFRREGLGASLVAILLLALVIYLKIRQIEQRQAAQ
jgi:predicted CXXCH cytochrome family protein